MSNVFDKLFNGYLKFQEQYVRGDHNLMRELADQGQSPDAMMIACCDSRVDPAVIFQTDPGRLFVVRNIANHVPAYSQSSKDSVNAALELSICHLQVKHLIILGHSECMGIRNLINRDTKLKIDSSQKQPDVNQMAKQAAYHAYSNCLTYPWIRTRVDDHSLQVHVWFFDIRSGTVSVYDHDTHAYKAWDRPSLLSDARPVR